MVVEALVVREQPEGSIAWGLYSAFYDPQQGQDLTTAFDWWHRGCTAVLPTDLCVHALRILQGWALPVDEFTSIKEYVDRISAFDQHLRTYVSSLQ